MSNFREIITLTRYIIECCFIASHFTSMVIQKKLWGFSWIYILFDESIDAWYFRISFQDQLIFLSLSLSCSLFSFFLFPSLSIALSFSLPFSLALFFLSLSSSSLSLSLGQSKLKHMNPWRWDLKSPIDVKMLKMVIVI